MNQTPEPDLRPGIAAQYLALADALDSIPEAAWETPSLCEGWRVREVIAHVTMPARYDHEAFMAELRARDFDFAQLSNEIAARDVQLPTEILLANLRDTALHRWAPGRPPPQGGYHGALNHAVIHGLDATVPLGLRPSASDGVMQIVLDDLTQHGIHEHFETSIAGRRLEATDLDWSYGSGATLIGSSADLALALCGRKLPPGRLHGSPL
jgi:uncharacterized protein (TIGR03083 family)